MRVTFVSFELPATELRLPKWADERTHCTVFNMVPIIAHPDYPPHRWDFKNKKWVKIPMPDRLRFTR